MRNATPAQYFNGASQLQVAGMVNAGMVNLYVVYCDRAFSDRDPTPGIVGVSSFAAAVDNPTPARMMEALPIVASLLKGRGTSFRETPVQGVGDQAVSLSGDVLHANGQQLEYQAIAARITRGILFGTEVRGRPVRRDLLITITSRIARDAESAR